MKDLILRNRYTLLVVTLFVYMSVLVAEGMITGREVKFIEFENPYFDMNFNDLEEFRERRNGNEDEEEDGRAGFEDGGNV